MLKLPLVFFVALSWSRSATSEGANLNLLKALEGGLSNYDVKVLPRGAPWAQEVGAALLAGTGAGKAGDATEEEGDIQKKPKFQTRPYKIATEAGDEYTCFIPVTREEDEEEEEEVSRTTGTGTTAGSRVDDFEGDQEDQDVSGIISTTGDAKVKGLVQYIKKTFQQMHPGGCLVRPTGFWTYEVCIGRSIRQYHQEPAQIQQHQHQQQGRSSSPQSEKAMETTLDFDLGSYVPGSEVIVTTSSASSSSPPTTHTLDGVPTGATAPAIPSIAHLVAGGTITLDSTYRGGTDRRSTKVHIQCDPPGMSSLTSPPPPPVAPTTPTTTTEKQTSSSAKAATTASTPASISSSSSSSPPSLFEIITVTETRPLEYDVLLGTRDPVICTALTSPSRIIAPINNTCLEHIDGWWTYELCLGGKLRQYHTEGGTGRVVQESVLGIYDWKEGEHMVAPGVGTTAAITQKYDRGTPCDIRNGIPRETIIRYECLPSAGTDGGNTGSSSSSTTTRRAYMYGAQIAFLGMQEAPTCVYTIRLGTSLVCEHPDVRGTVKATTVQEPPSDIICIPTEDE